MIRKAARFNKLASEIKAEYEKTLKYIETMGRKVVAGAVLNAFNEKIHDVVEKFEEDEVWI